MKIEELASLLDFFTSNFAHSVNFKIILRKYINFPLMLNT